MIGIGLGVGLKEEPLTRCLRGGLGGVISGLLRYIGAVLGYIFLYVYM